MEFRKILIIKLSAIGDVIHALPVAHALKQTYPMSRVTWIVERPAYDLLRNNPCIDEIIVFDKPQYKSLTGALRNGPVFAKMLKSHQFDLAIDLQGLFKSAAVAWLSGAPRRVGYCNMREMSHWISKPTCGLNQNGHVVERYLDVVRALDCNVQQAVFPIHITEEEKQQTKAITAQAGLDMDQQYLVLAPGTNWSSKCWPTEHYARLIDKLHEDGHVPVLIGGPADTKLGEEILSQSKARPVNLIGGTTLKQLAYIIKKAVVFTGGDTGPMHLAAALNTPVIALFGPTDPARNGPYGANHTVITASVPCVGCWQRVCSKPEHCMKSIEVEKVYRVLKQKL